MLEVSSRIWSLLFPRLSLVSWYLSTHTPHLVVVLRIRIILLHRVIHLVLLCKEPMSLVSSHPFSRVLVLVVSFSQWCPSVPSVLRVMLHLVHQLVDKHHKCPLTVLHSRNHHIRFILRTTRCRKLSDLAHPPRCMSPCINLWTSRWRSKSLNLISLNGIRLMSCVKSYRLWHCLDIRICSRWRDLLWWRVSCILWPRCAMPAHVLILWSVHSLMDWMKVPSLAFSSRPCKDWSICTRRDLYIETWNLVIFWWRRTVRCGLQILECPPPYMMSVIEESWERPLWGHRVGYRRRLCSRLVIIRRLTYGLLVLLRWNWLMVEHHSPSSRQWRCWWWPYRMILRPWIEIIASENLLGRSRIWLTLVSLRILPRGHLLINCCNIPFSGMPRRSSIWWMWL